MTPADIILIAQEAGVEVGFSDWRATNDTLVKFAALVAAHEREVIAKMFDGPVFAYDYREIASAIRARGEKP